MGLSVLISAADPTPWLAIFIPTIISVGGYWLARRSDRKKLDAKEQAHQRELDRKEDILWGYVDSQGIRHVGVVDTVKDLRGLLEHFSAELERLKAQKGS